MIEAELADLPRAMGQILREVPIPVVVSRRADHLIVAVNPAAADFFGRPAEELVQLTVDDVTAATDRPTLESNYARLSTSSLAVDKYYIRGDGSLVPGRVHLISHGADEDLVTAAIVDMSDHLASVAQLETLVELGDRLDEHGDHSCIDDGADAAWLTKTLRSRHDIDVELVDARDPASPRPHFGVSIGPLSYGFLVDRSDRPADARNAAFLTAAARDLAAGRMVRDLRRRLAAAALFETGFETTQVGMQVVAQDGTLLRVNDAFARMIGRTRDEIEGHHWREFTHPDHLRPELTGDEELHEIKRYVHRDGSEVWASLSSSVVRVDEPVGAGIKVRISHIVDLTEQMEARSALEASEANYRSLALVDPLTGASNRAAFLDRAQHALDRLSRQARPRGLAIALLDLDHFKSVNDTFGHDAGDRALTTTVDALRRVTRDIDTIGRLGGDEFVVLFEDVPSLPLADQLGARLAESLGGATVRISGSYRLPLSASIGLVWTDQAVPIADFMARADRAMYEAKRRGRGRVWTEIAPDQVDDRPSDSALRRDLANALRRRQFELHYQPIVDVQRGAVTALEALLRWRHPSEGILAPDRFLDELMRSGQIGAVGRWALQTAIRDLVQWQRDPALRGVKVHLNATPAELAHASYAQFVRRELDEAGVDPSLLVVEVTEVALDGTILSGVALEELTRQGVGLALDDFGTGVSSFSHLRDRPLSTVKIDKSFVHGATHSSPDQAIVEASLAMGARLGIDIVAEGVESADQLAWLRNAGCRLVQGWYFSRAVPADRVAATAAASVERWAEGRLALPVT